MTPRQLPFQNSPAGQPTPNTRELADIIAALATAPQKIDPAIPAKQFFGHGEARLIDCEMRQIAPRLIELRRLILSKFRW